MNIIAPTKTDFVIRNIVQADNLPLSIVIKRTIEEFKINQAGTIYVEESTNHLFELFESKPGSDYFVVELNGKVAGGAGIFPTDQLPDCTCELVKMYLKPQARGKGIAKQLIQKCLTRAKELNYNSVYLESMPELSRAISLYEYFGFSYLDKPMGDGKHSSTSIWMIKQI